MKFHVGDRVLVNSKEVGITNLTGIIEDIHHTETTCFLGVNLAESGWERGHNLGRIGTNNSCYWLLSRELTNLNRKSLVFRRKK